MTTDPNTPDDLPTAEDILADAGIEIEPEPEYETHEFDLSSPETETVHNDIYVDETYVNAYNDQRAYLKGDTYEAKEIIKFDWNVTHHSFDGDSKRWEVDASGLAPLEEQLLDAGYDVDFAGDLERLAETDGTPEGPLDELCAFVEDGDQISVEYHKKTGTGTSTFEGTVVNSEYDSDTVRFRRDDNQSMYIRTDKRDTPSLFTSGSHAPYVGAIETVEVRR